jgi:hypothetical protein
MLDSGLVYWRYSDEFGERTEVLMRSEELQVGGLHNVLSWCLIPGIQAGSHVVTQLCFEARTSNNWDDVNTLLLGLFRQAHFETLAQENLTTCWIYWRSRIPSSRWMPSANVDVYYSSGMALHATINHQQIPPLRAVPKRV